MPTYRRRASRVEALPKYTAGTGYQDEGDLFIVGYYVVEYGPDGKVMKQYEMTKGTFEEEFILIQPPSEFRPREDI